MVSLAPLKETFGELFGFFRSAPKPKTKEINFYENINTLNKGFSILFRIHLNLWTRNI